jgi:cytochrome b561
MAQLRNSDSRYGLILILLHWAAAAAIVALLATAVGIMTAPNEDVEGTRIQLHVWTGSLLYLVIGARILWSWIERKPALLSGSARERVLARFVHGALLTLIAVQLVTGPLAVWSGGWPVEAFDLFTIPSPFSGPQPWHDAIGEVHEYSGLAIFLLLSLHLAGVLKHALIDRDGTLSRMLGLRGGDRGAGDAAPHAVAERTQNPA